MTRAPRCAAGELCASRFGASIRALRDLCRRTIHICGPESESDRRLNRHSRRPAKRRHLDPIYSRDQRYAPPVCDCLKTDDAAGLVFSRIKGVHTLTLRLIEEKDPAQLAAIPVDIRLGTTLVRAVLLYRSKFSDCPAGAVPNSYPELDLPWDNVIAGQGMAPLYGASASPGPSPRPAAGRDDSTVCSSEDSSGLYSHDAAASRPKQSSSKNGQVAARAIRHHSATLVSGAGVPPHCLEAVYSRLQVVQLVSDCCFWRRVHSNYLLVAEYAYGPPPGSAHFLSSLIESSRS